MMQAHLSDQKTMTRRLAKRLVKTYPNGRGKPPTVLVERDSPWTKVKAGDRLWSREDWRVSKKWEKTKPADLPEQTMSVVFTAGGSIANQAGGGWRPDLEWPRAGQWPEWIGRRRAAMHQPRWASRLTLIVTAVKVEHLHDMTEEDALAEGVERLPPQQDRFGRGWAYKSFWTTSPRAAAVEAYRDIWCGLHGEESWDANPLVVAMSYRVIKANIDAPEARIAA